MSSDKFIQGDLFSSSIYSDDFKVCCRLKAILYSLRSMRSHADRIDYFLDSLLSGTVDIFDSQQKGIPKP